MSLDLLKEARTLLADGVSAAEALFGRHQSATQVGMGAADAHTAISAEFANLKGQFGDLLTKVDAAIAGIEAAAAAAAATPLAERIKALVAQL